ncbi:hypothetical protein [Methyloligella solikamskensis]|uniref:Uncharacterized protein n=1 Tax=Methyloligella solikamskensis TaxID=1177756 RepID=A0ABW3JCS7_9HYPH
MSSRRTAGIVALALAAGIFASQIVLVLTAGSVGIPGLFTIHLGGEEPGDVGAENESSDRRSRTRTTPPPIATPAPPEDEPTSSSSYESETAKETGQDESSAPLAQPADDEKGVAQPANDDSEAAEAKPEAPSSGPVGWQGPEGAPGSDTEADGEAVLDGPIDLDVGDALSDLNREEAEEEDKKEDEPSTDAGPSGGPAPAAQPAPPPASGASGQREVLPWEAIVPDPDLMSPVDVPEDTPEFSLPEPDTVRKWLQGRASNLAAGNTRYELWLEPSMDMRLRLTAVGYQFKPPDGEMITRLSRRPESGFRVSFEGTSCEGNLTLTLTYKDGRSHKVPVDGCSAVQ